MPPRHSKCSSCDTVFPHLRHCARCKNASYCNPTCQRNDWNLRHKWQCHDLSPAELVAQRFEQIAFRLSRCGEDRVARRVQLVRVDSWLQKSKALREYCMCFALGQLSDDRDAASIAGMRRFHLLVMNAEAWPLEHTSNPGELEIAQEARNAALREFADFFGPPTTRRFTLNDHYSRMGS